MLPVVALIGYGNIVEILKGRQKFGFLSEGRISLNHYTFQEKNTRIEFIHPTSLIGELCINNAPEL